MDPSNIFYNIFFTVQLFDFHNCTTNTNVASNKQSCFQLYHAQNRKAFSYFFLSTSYYALTTQNDFSKPASFVDCASTKYAKPRCWAAYLQLYWGSPLVGMSFIAGNDALCSSQGKKFGRGG